MPLNTSNMDTKDSVLLLGMCTHVTALLTWMICGAHLMYLSFQALRQHSIRYRGTAMSWTAGHRAVAHLKLLHFCMTCTIAFIEVRALTFCQVVHSYPLNVGYLVSNSQVCAYRHYSHLTVPEATQMYLLGINPCMGGSVQLINY